VKRWSFLDWFLFAAFLFWSAAGLIFTAEHWTDADISQWPVSRGVIAFAQGCLAYGDPILILLAFANTHMHAARQWTPAIARRWALLILVASLGIETVGTISGLPFGIYHYTGRFGPMLGLVPLTIPLAWHVVVTNALFVARLLLPSASRPAEAALTALICTLYDFVLEPFATGTRQYWIWQGGKIPLLNYLAWFVLSGLLVLLFAPRYVVSYRRDPRPVIILAVTITIFVVGR
jgi:putative membrane protein